MPDEQPRRVDGYIRVSRVAGREGPSYQSPGQQRAAIEAWAKYKGVDISEWHVDEDQSGGTQNRPGLNAAMDRVEDRATDGIACWDIDRFSRSVIGGLTDIKRIRDAGAHIAFVAQDIDTTGYGGRLVLTTLLAQGEYMLDKLKAGWRTAKSNAIARGASIGPTNVGYTRGPGGVLHIDPDRGRVVAAAFRAAGGLGVDAARRVLTAGVPEMTWTTFTVKRLLGNRTYLGEARYGDLINDNAHEALVTRAEFEAAQATIAALGDVTRRKAEMFPLSGVAECAGCGAKLVGGRGGVDARRTYRCSAKCSQAPTITASILETHVIGVLRAADRGHGFRVGESDDSGAAALAELDEAEQELDAFAGDLTARKALGDRYHHHLKLRARAVDDARRVVRDVMASQRAATVMVPAEVWDSLTPEELAVVLRSAVDTITVRRGRGLSVEDRVVVIAK